MFTPHTGRWLSRDPSAYSLGPDRYVYVRNNPQNLVDPSGLVPQIPLTRNRPTNQAVPSLRRQFFDRMLTIQSGYRNQSSCLWDRSGLNVTFRRLINRAMTVNVAVASAYNPLNTSAAFHDAGTIWVSSAGLAAAQNHTLVHELVHALDFQNQWNLGGLQNANNANVESAEALTYGFQFMLEQYEQLSSLEARVKKGTIDCKDLQGSLDRALQSFDKPDFPVTYGRFNTTRPGQLKDLVMASRRLGVNLSCANIIACFQSKKCCLKCGPPTTYDSLMGGDDPFWEKKGIRK